MGNTREGLVINNLRLLRILRVRNNVKLKDDIGRPREVSRINFSYDGEKYILDIERDIAALHKKSIWNETLDKRTDSNQRRGITGYTLIELAWKAGMDLSTFIRRIDMPKSKGKDIETLNYSQVDLEFFVMKMAVHGLVKSNTSMVQNMFNEIADSALVKGYINSTASELAHILISKFYLTDHRIASCNVSVIQLNAERLIENIEADNKHYEELKNLVRILNNHIEKNEKALKKLFKTSNNNMKYLYNWEKTANLYSKHIFQEGEFCTEYNRNYGDKYLSGVLTDLRTLEEGVLFEVTNGNYSGIITKNEKGQKCIVVQNERFGGQHVLTDERNSAYIRICIYDMEDEDEF